MENIILVVGLVSYIIFGVQFLLALIGYDADIDLDVDLDGNVDFSMSDLVSFKGLIHFLMGVTTFLYTKLHAGIPLTTWSYIGAFIVGVIFVAGLYYVYKLCMKLQHQPQREEGDLGERYATIIRKEGDTYIASATINGAYDLFVVETSQTLEIGKEYKISKFINNKIFI